MHTAQQIQSQQQAHQVKLTAVTVQARGVKLCRFIHCRHNDQGRAVIPALELDRMLNQLGVVRGMTYTIGS